MLDDVILVLRENRSSFEKDRIANFSGMAATGTYKLLC